MKTQVHLFHQASNYQKKRSNLVLIIYFVTPKENEKFHEPLVALGISFPKSENAETVTYVAGAGYNLVEDEF